MNMAAYSDRLRNLVNETANEARERAIFFAATRLRANIQNRINRKGEDSEGGEMPGYSSKPGYYDKDKFVVKSRFKPLGKNGYKGDRLMQSQNIRINKKTGKVTRGKIQTRVVRVTPHTMYLEHGYKQFRELNGRQTSVKDFFFKGDLFKSFQVGKDGEAVLIGFDSSKESKKRRGLEAQVKAPVFKAQKGEIETYLSEVAREETKIVNRIIQNLET